MYPQLPPYILITNTQWREDEAYWQIISQKLTSVLRYISFPREFGSRNVVTDICRKEYGGILNASYWRLAFCRWLTAVKASNPPITNSASNRYIAKHLAISSRFSEIWRITCLFFAIASPDYMIFPLHLRSDGVIKLLPLSIAYQAPIYVEVEAVKMAVSWGLFI